MHFHICNQELMLISALMPYINVGYFYTCQLCGKVLDKFRSIATEQAGITIRLKLLN